MAQGGGAEGRGEAAVQALGAIEECTADRVGKRVVVTTRGQVHEREHPAAHEQG